MRSGGGMLEINQPTPIDTFLQMTILRNSGVDRFDIVAPHQSFRLHFTDMLDRQRGCRYWINDKIIHVRFD